MSAKPGRSGRPSLYTPQLADEICERLAKGESLRAICSDPHMPDKHRVREWALNDREGFSPRYAIARSIGYEQMAQNTQNLPMSAKRGRPSVYTPEIADEICERLAAGESLNAICSDPHIPSYDSVQRWIVEESEARPGFCGNYARARTAGYELMAEQVIAIGDDPCMFDGKPDNVLVQRARLMSDNRKWLLSKMLPKIYGDRVTQELVGDEGRPIVTRIELVPISPRRPAIEGPEDK